MNVYGRSDRVVYRWGDNMKNERKLIQFFFLTNPESAVHYHQSIEILYVLKGKMGVQIDEVQYMLHDGDFLLVNANKRHAITAKEKLFGARFEIDFHLLAEYMGTIQIMFWCNTMVDKNDAYKDMRKMLDRILERYFEKEEKGALYLNALYFEMLYLLTSNFMVKADDVRLDMENTQDRIRVRQIQNYIQANYQSQISLNDLAEKLFLSNAYLSKYIKKHLGLTFVEYLNNIRVFHAVDELLYTNKSITRIAMDNGFPTSAAFNKVFRNIHGEAPNTYRKRMQKMQPDVENGESQEEKEQQILEYLKYKENKTEPEEKNKKACIADAERYRNCDMMWNKAVNVGEAYALLQSEVQNQLLEIQRETGMIYARIWNLLSKDVCMDEKEYNFRKLDLVLDFLVDNQMKPYIEFGHKPGLFMYTHERVLMEDGDDRGIYDYETFSALIREFCLHLVNRYGVDAIESWYFEYWNDPKLHMLQKDGEYYTYFETVYRTLKNISPEIKVGGAGFILGYETPACRDIFQIWKEREIYPDFLSFCSYQYISLVEGGQWYGKKSIDGHYMEHQVEVIREVMQKTGFQIPEIHINEWNFTVSNRNVINDGCTQGAYILKTCINMAGNVDFMVYWHALDLYSEYYDSDNVFNGDSGMISRDGIRKPSFYAFQFLNRLLPNVMKKDEQCIVTTNGRGRYVIACHNYKKLSADYVFTEEDEIRIEQQKRFMENTDPLYLTVRLTHVRNGDYQIKIYYVNKENGNAQEIWRKLDCTKRLVRDEVEYMKKRAAPSMEMKTVQVKDGVLELENILLPQEIRLLDIQYRYSI